MARQTRTEIGRYLGIAGRRFVGKGDTLRNWRSTSVVVLVQAGAEESKPYVGPSC